MTPRTGRPPIPDNLRRTATLMIRLNPAERDLIKAAGGGSWARNVLLRAAKNDLRLAAKRQR